MSIYSILKNNKVLQKVADSAVLAWTYPRVDNHWCGAAGQAGVARLSRMSVGGSVQPQPDGQPGVISPEALCGGEDAGPGEQLQQGTWVHFYFRLKWRFSFTAGKATTWTLNAHFARVEADEKRAKGGTGQRVEALQLRFTVGAEKQIKTANCGRIRCA